MSATAVLSGRPNHSDPPTLDSDSSNKYFIAAAAAAPLENSSWNKNVLFFRPQAAAVGNSLFP